MNLISLLSLIWEQKFLLAVFLTAGVILFLLSIPMFFLLALWVGGAYCRLVIISKSGIRRGLLCPQTIAWEEVSQAGMAPLLVGRTKSGDRIAGRTAIFIAKGSLQKRQVYQYGILEIWTQLCMKNHFPYLERFLALLARKAQHLWVDEELALPDVLIWMKYSDSSLDMIRDMSQDHGIGAG